MTFKDQIKVIEFLIGCISWILLVMTKVYMKHIWWVIYGISVDLITFDLGWPFKVKSNIIEFLMGCIFWMVHVMTKFYMKHM